MTDDYPYTKAFIVSYEKMITVIDGVTCDTCEDYIDIISERLDYVLSRRDMVLLSERNQELLSKIRKCDFSLLEHSQKLESIFGLKIGLWL